MKLYTAAALAKEAGVTYRQVHYWTESGALHVLDIEGAKKDGSGQRRLYAASEVEVARRLGVLLGRPPAEWANDIRKAMDGHPSHLPFSLTITKTPTSGAA